MSRLTAADLRAAGYCPETGARLAPAAGMPPPPAVAVSGRDVRQSRSQAKPSETVVQPTGDAPRPSKYGNRRCEGPSPCGGTRTYASRKEARHAARRNALKSAGQILDWYPQPTLDTGIDERKQSRRYRADALVIREQLPGGWFVGRFEDDKGFDTPSSLNKRAALRNRGLDVAVIRE